MTDPRRTYLAVRDRQLLRADGRNRGLRTFIVALGADVILAVVLALVAYFQSANGWGDLEWTVIAFGLAKTAMTSVGAYLLRTVVDPKGSPVPLPPAPQPAPADPTRTDGA